MPHIKLASNVEHHYIEEKKYGKALMK